MSASINALVTMKSAAEGGRRSAFSVGYSPHLVVDAGELMGVRVAAAPPQVLPGAEATIEFQLLYAPNVDYSALLEGTSFDIVEGPNVVGTGVVIGTSIS